jgi:hypothetical protein
LFNKWLGLALAGPSALMVFKGMWWLFDNHVWRWKSARHLLLVPDLNGKWKVTGKTISKNGQPTPIDWAATITIVQSWTKMRVRLTTKSSGSRSVGATLERDAGVGYWLMYPYENDPLPGEQELKRHRGFARLLFDEETRSAQGEYFTDKDRVTHGSMELQRMEDDHGTS